MLYAWKRRCLRHRFLALLTILTTFLILSFLLRTDSILTIIAQRNDHGPRLFCILILNDPTHARYVQLKNISWIRDCHALGIVKYKRLHRLDDDPKVPQSPSHVNLWRRILVAIRESISSFALISHNDTLVIVPAPTYVFRQKLPSLLSGSSGHSRTPLIVIHEQDNMNAYIFNGLALDRVRNTDLVDSCLQRSYISAREKHLWTCIKYDLRRAYPDVPCENSSCFIRRYRPEFTLGHIKNGSCLKDHQRQCQSIALLYPTTPSDLITLEYFKYRLKPPLPHDSL